MADYLSQCMADLQTAEVEPFKATFCDRCRNQDCTNARWSEDRFKQRVSTQADRLLRPKLQIIQPEVIKKHPKYSRIDDFVNLAKEAIRLESSAQRNDWTVDPSLEAGVPELSSNPAAAAEIIQIATPEAPPPVSPPPVSEPPAPVKKDEFFQPPGKNTPPPPSGGVMVGGGDPPKATPPKPVQDPWETKPATPTVTPGTRIKMGGQK